MQLIVPAMLGKGHSAVLHCVYQRRRERRAQGHPWADRPYLAVNMFPELYDRLFSYGFGLAMN